MIERKNKDSIFRYPADRVLTDAKLQAFIDKNDQLTAKRYSPLLQAYENDYKIFHQAKKPAFKPDNRIAVNFAQYITDTFEGFFMGVPARVSATIPAVQEYLARFEAYSGADDHNAELSNLVSIFGRAYEIYFVDQHGEIDMAYLDPIDGFMVYDECIEPDPLYFVRTYYDFDGIRRGSIADGETVRYFHIAGGIQWDGEPLPHGFDGVPATEYVQNRSRRGIFENVLNLIDALNKALSEKANDVDAFADAYLKILGAKLQKEDLDYIRDNRIINMAGDMAGKALDVDFLERPSADATQENLLNRLEREIFQIAMVVNISDDNFTAASGTALKYRLQPMINLAGTKQRKITAGFNRRYRLIFSNLCAGVSPDAWTDLSYAFSLNLPSMLAEEADAAGKLSGITSRRTQLRVLSCVEDPDQELKEIEKENDLTAYKTDYPTDRGGDSDG